jgi:hypothetical protein
MIWAVVPAKTLEQAKTRLAQVLSPEERRVLSLAMLRDVLGALRGAQHLAGVAVVTADAALEKAASAAGAEIVIERTTGQNIALEAGIGYAQTRGATHGVRNEITNQAYSIVGRGQRRPCTEKGSLRSGSCELRLVATDAEVTKCPPEPLHVIYAARCTTRGHRLMAELDSSGCYATVWQFSAARCPFCL